MMEQKSHPGARWQVHHWKWVHAEFGKKVYLCLNCKVRKISKLNPGSWPSTVYRAPNGTEYGRAPECSMKKALDSGAEPARA